MGYRRANGAVGIRNHVLVLPSVVCANRVARGISQLVEGTTWVEHQHGCTQLGADAELTRRVARFARDPSQCLRRRRRGAGLRDDEGAGCCSRYPQGGPSQTGAPRHHPGRGRLPEGNGRGGRCGLGDGEGGLR